MEEIIPQEGKKARVEKMFNDISGRYDLLNHLLSFGIDRRWRKLLIGELAATHPKRVLDVATGTGDLALATAKNTAAQVTGTDIAGKMLQIAEKKASAARLADRINLVQADGESLPFPDSAFDAVTIAFGIRNFENPLAGLREFHRVLNTNGTALILEFSMPSSAIVKMLYRLYFGKILPLIGRLVSRHPDAYSYLPASVDAFPHGKAFADLMQKAGFSQINIRKLSGGISTLYIGKKV